MTDFILIHGGYGGAWCWDLLIPELERLGHRGLAMDLPIDQPDIWVDDYARAVAAAVAGIAAPDAFLVGHSFAGCILPRVAALRPAARLIFLSAALAWTSDEEHVAMEAATDTASYYRWLQLDDRNRAFFSEANAIAAFFHDLPPDLARWAAGKLRPQWVPAMASVAPTAPYADRVAGIIDCDDDRILFPVAHRALARRLFGIDPIMLPGGHSPFLSHPARLAQALDWIARADRAHPPGKSSP